MLRTVLSTLEVEIPVGKSFLVYASAVFANNVTPFGQSGGEPIAALLISKVSIARYETGLAGIATVDVLNVVSSVSMIMVGVGYYATTARVGERLETAVGSALALIAGIELLMLFVWRRRDRIVERVSGTVAIVVGRLPIGSSDPTAIGRRVAERLHRFFGRLERIATSRERLAVVLGLSLLGWLFQTAALLAAFAAIGHAVPIYVALFAIPLGNLAGGPAARRTRRNRGRVRRAARPDNGDRRARCYRGRPRLSGGDLLAARADRRRLDGGVRRSDDSVP